MEEEKRLLARILDGAENPRDLSFELLKHITNDFSEERKIGQGGFGEVYKGVLGERIVAVKRIHINETTIDDKLFHSEVTSLMKCNHRNVIQFLGVCSGGYQKPIEKDGSGEFIWTNVLERLLCFRYISNGSLDRHITDELRGLEWEARYEIITGICKGLLYLHKEKNIIHMDLKPANILLDHQDEKYMVPKITEFGLSTSNKNSHTVGQRFGTREYMAPEYRDESKTTQSCDIYSLGLIIIELVTGSKDVPNKDNVLRRWRHRWKKPPTQLQYQQVTRCIDIAGQCRRKNPKDRPSICELINFLSLSESTYWQISPLLDEDDMLRINPLEVRLPFELKDDISFTIELINETRNCIIAFNIQIPSTLYNAQPDKGIVRPQSKYSLKIKVKARDVGERVHADKFIFQSMKVEVSEGLGDEDISEGLGDEDIIEHMFEKTGRFIDEVDLMVVYESTKPQENFKRGEDTNTPAEEVPKPENCEYSSGSSGKAEEASMVITNWKETENKILVDQMRSLQYLKDITNNFSEKRILGQGGSGVVYRGELQNGNLIAVKKVNTMHISEELCEKSKKLFENEVALLMGLEHPNIVQLLNYCYRMKADNLLYGGIFCWQIDTLLCLEYLPKGSLDNHISDATSGLDWRTRYKIIEGISNGLRYLHEQPDAPIIHLDLKPANILLDANMVPKIADFGISRLYNEGKTIHTKSNVGTIGYMPPEYILRGTITPDTIKRGIITSMSDIFGLGVIIMEIVTGHKDYPFEINEASSKDFINIELEKWRNMLEKEPGNTNLETDCQQIEKCIHIGLKCVNPERTERPTIRTITKMIQGLEECRPFTTANVPDEKRGNMILSALTAGCIITALISQIIYQVYSGK